MDYTDDYNGYKWHERSSFSPVYAIFVNCFNWKSLFLIFVRTYED